ncbi:hypothetical protein ElyMa_002029300 [Elysia marginata]|uniref:Uncharacterized protein n=1 Tax=Elysia marginata TaxID=1093978 RepID=A0AAV4F654_9GAST|nr:hypothetical protein ElyMa_002029300 [Elysia marginata]
MKDEMLDRKEEKKRDIEQDIEKQKVRVSISDGQSCHSVWTSNRSQAVKWRCEGINRLMAIPAASAVGTVEEGKK